MGTCRWLAGLFAVGAFVGATPAAGVAQSVGDNQRVARNASEVPADWIAANPQGGCYTNPFMPACGAPGRPITVAYFPSAAQLKQQSDPNAPPYVGPGVTLPGGTTIIARRGSTTQSGKFRVKAHAATAVCILTVYAPSRISVGGNIKMASTTSLDGCVGGVIEANACSDLYQRTVFVANDCDPSFGTNPTSVATAIYDCGHSNIIQYKNHGYGYIEGSDGSAGFNQFDAYSNHSCT